MDCWRSSLILPPTARPTLVLDMDGTLLYTKQRNPEVGKVQKRPCVHEFLKSMGRVYELVLWTSADQDYAAWAIEQLETEGPLFAHKLCSQAFGNDLTKDVKKLGRDLRRVVLVDDERDSIATDVLENAIVIESYTGNEDDNERLPRLGKLLESMVGGQDFRKELRCIRKQGGLHEIEEDQEEEEEEEDECDHVDDEKDENDDSCAEEEEEDEGDHVYDEKDENDDSCAEEEEYESDSEPDDNDNSEEEPLLKVGKKRKLKFSDRVEGKFIRAL